MTDETEEFDPGERNVGLVETQSATLFDESHLLALESGKQFGPVTVAYETYGQLAAEKNNAIFVCHALTGDAHVAGYNSKKDRKPGWWDEFVGPGKGLDTDKYFIICANVLSGCTGTTGPSSFNTATNRPYGLGFPFITVGDIVRVHSELVRHLGIEKLLAVIGGSLGGMQVLQWAASFPDQLNSAICLASAAKLSAQGIAFNAVGRRAILIDPKYNGGDYYYDDEEGPRYGLALARMVAHITYLSEVSIENKFGRRLQTDEQEFSFDLAHETEFQVESYLHYQGKRFVERFDANSYLCLTHAMDYFDLAASFGTLADAFRKTSARFLITSYTSDWLFPTAQSQKIVRALLQAQQDVTFVELESSYGHDAFLLEVEQLNNMITPFLEQTLIRCKE